MEQKPHLTVVIGGNGAGKTTWARSHKDLLPKKFFNADSLAEALGDANFPENQREARVMVDQKIQSSLHAGRSFGFESTYSGRSRPSVVREAKDRGYTTEAVFIGTESHDVNIERVRKRVKDGGHDIPVEEIKRRWKATFQNLRKTWNALDVIHILDNTGTGPRLIARKYQDRVETVSDLPTWANEIRIYQRIGQRGKESQSSSDSVTGEITEQANIEVEPIGKMSRTIEERTGNSSRETMAERISRESRELRNTELEKKNHQSNIGGQDNHSKRRGNVGLK